MLKNRNSKIWVRTVNHLSNHKLLLIKDSAAILYKAKLLSRKYIHQEQTTKSHMNYSDLTKQKKVKALIAIWATESKLN